MTANVCADPPALASSAGELAALLENVAEIERLQAEAVALAGRVARSGACERLEGLPLDLLLASEARMTGGDRHTLITAGQVLETMPRLARAHRDGRVSWSEVRHVVRLVRRRSLEDRAVIDQRIDATLAGEGGVERFDPDAFVAAVEAATDELTSRRALEQREERAAAANRLWAQPGFDGRVHGGFEYDAISAATLLNAVAAQQGKPAADDPEREPEIPTPQQRSAAEALVEICEQHLAGGGSDRRARPTYVADVDIAGIDASQPGRLRLRLPGAPRRVTARRLAADAAAGADVRVVIRDGAAPLAVSGVVRTDAKHLDRDQAAEDVELLAVPRPARAGIAALVAAVNRALNHPDLARALATGERPLADPGMLDAEDIPAATRIAVTMRDKGCRFSGCDAPADWCDVHHIHHRADGGDHHPDRLVLLCRFDHRLVHEHGWRLRLDPATGGVTGRRGGRAWQTLPRGSPLARAPDPPRRPAAAPLPLGRPPPLEEPHADSDLPF